MGAPVTLIVAGTWGVNAIVSAKEHFYSMHVANCADSRRILDVTYGVTKWCNKENSEYKIPRIFKTDDSEFSFSIIFKISLTA